MQIRPEVGLLSPPVLPHQRDETAVDIVRLRELVAVTVYHGQRLVVPVA